MVVRRLGSFWDVLSFRDELSVSEWYVFSQCLGQPPAGIIYVPGRWLSVADLPNRLWIFSPWVNDFAHPDFPPKLLNVKVLGFFPGIPYGWDLHPLACIAWGKPSLSGSRMLRHNHIWRSDQPFPLKLFWPWASLAVGKFPGKDGIKSCQSCWERMKGSFLEVKQQKPLKMALPKRKGSSSNHHFSGAMVNFGGEHLFWNDDSNWWLMTVTMVITILVGDDDNDGAGERERERDDNDDNDDNDIDNLDNNYIHYFEKY